ncbi:hypothetical protein PT07_00141 [Pseudomonas phage PT07]|nr:hypothetical protein PT07_00141 [Pseudomonas phage PT07]
MNNKLRKEFDKWWAQDEQEELRKSCAKGWAEYVWIASRAALRVGLPAKRSYSMYVTKHECHAFNDAIERAKEALQRAGIEVK